MSNYKSITAKELESLQEAGDVLILDIREQDEFNREHIPGARCVPLSGFNPDKLAENHDKESIVVFHCQSGNRTHQAREKLAATGFDQVCILEGGLSAWKKSAGETKGCEKAPLPLMRQVQIIVGAMVLLGIVLGYLFSPLFALISAFFGAGLLFAGISGYCGLAKVLLLLPYNRCSKKRGENR